MPSGPDGSNGYVNNGCVHQSSYGSEFNYLYKSVTNRLFTKVNVITGKGKSGSGSGKRSKNKSDNLFINPF